MKLFLWVVAVYMGWASFASLVLIVDRIRKGAAVKPQEMLVRMAVLQIELGISVTAVALLVMGGPWTS